MNKNNTENQTTQLPLLLDWVITLLAAAVAVFEALVQWFRAIRASDMGFGRKLAHGVAAVWVSLSRARHGVRSIRTGT